ncbi:hypothetical protein Pcinc_027460 [Petrolisthes cinctipes]|uniref:Uncharacterized protein n=1 Tax=Petrolisthes cinctipes TaxID=88211 RepID=A0AAE1F4U5_PETCI|nr:hypothetical protein Pcinc_027460 [Petrolisthes cinctipes]
MGGGSGRACQTVLPLLPLSLSSLLLLLVLATHASCTPLPSVSRAPPQPGVAEGGRREVQYTLDLLPQPASTETEDREGHRLTSQATVEAQLLPWAVGAATGGGPGCIKIDVALRAAHLALQHQPPPAGVSVVVLPPPPG